MPVPARTAASHRQRLLGRVRAVSLGIAGGAAVATLGIGTAFAHAIPGHSAPASTPSAPAAPAPAAPAGTAPAQPGSSSPAARSGTAPARRRHAGLAAPARPPAPATAAPQTASGGS